MSTNRGLTRRQAVIASAGAGLGIAGAGANAFAAQDASPEASGDTPTKPFLTLETAQVALDAALEEAHAIGVPMNVMILDDSATMKIFARQDGAMLGSVTIATNKATTSASFNAPTHTLAEAFRADPVLLASFSTIPNVTLIPGGYPIMLDGSLVGAIGVSGGTGEEDQQCAEAALAAIGAD